MGICSICQTEFFSFQIWRWRRCDCGGSDMAPIWSWLSCSISLNCHKYFSDTSNIFVPMWLLGSRLGADMIATWRRYDWHLACENRQYRKIWQIYQVLVLLYLYTLYCIEHCRLINIYSNSIEIFNAVDFDRKLWFNDDTLQSKKRLYIVDCENQHVGKDEGFPSPMITSTHDEARN